MSAAPRPALRRIQCRCGTWFSQTRRTQIHCSAICKKQAHDARGRRTKRAKVQLTVEQLQAYWRRWLEAEHAAMLGDPRANRYFTRLLGRSRGRVA